MLFEDRSWTWREIVAASNARAAALVQRLDPARPPHVGVLLGNTPDYACTLLGAALAGLTVVGLNTTRRGPELARDARHTDCQLVLTDATGAQALAGQDVPPLLRVDEPEWDQEVQDRLDATLPADLPDPATTYVLIFTSGSTSAPKAVRRSQGRIAGLSQAMGFRAKDVLYCSMPLSHGNALQSNLIPALASGATVALRERFSASQWLPDVQRTGATFFNTVGRALGYLLETPPSDDDRAHRVRFALAPETSPRDAADFQERFGIPVISGYGASEGALTLHPAPVPGSMGTAPPGADVAVVDPQSGTERPPARFDAAGRLLNADEAIGELVRRDGVAAFEGYYGNDEATAERTRNGWFWSGDLAYRDADGVFFFAGRSGDWLRVDSENFAAAPVERVLARHPDVAAAQVYAVPDVSTGDQVMAAVQLRTGTDPCALDAWLSEQGDLSPKWAPRYYRLVAEMPLTGTAKLDKKPLRAQGWRTADPVWWRPGRGEPLRPLRPEDVAALEDALAAAQRAHLLPERTP
jgi:fatty-acyl-CoA synthase